VVRLKLQKLLTNEHADVKMVGAVVALLITIIVAILIFYNVAGSIDTTNADLKIAENVYGDVAGGNDDYRNNTTFAGNSSGSILDQAATFFSVAPIIAIVIIAVVILGYVSRIGG